ncbi:hypothetical protein [Streptomyces mirabilis]|uniref:hypothetical protein n=1 Tax=Streptomyces mirabilis TaxID=68239 RepID=UPI003688F8A7
MPVTLKKVLKTPEQVAQAVLDGIAGDPESFDMDYWVDLYGAESLPPEGDVCGTTLCAAGWVAHVTGWTLHTSWDNVHVVDRRGEGDDYVREYAERDGVRRRIDDVAQEALGLRDGETFWTESAESAIKRLREIAGWR